MLPAVENHDLAEAESPNVALRVILTTNPKYSAPAHCDCRMHHLASEGSGLPPNSLADRVK
jgi:hypothetical protein